MVLMRQGEQAWLLTSAGNHEFARVFYCDDGRGKGTRYILREGVSKLGQHTLLAADVDERGLELTWSTGYKSLIPRDWYQLTWT
jgi:hypothetical protein